MHISLFILHFSLTKQLSVRQKSFTVMNLCKGMFNKQCSIEFCISS